MLAPRSRPRLSRCRDAHQLSPDWLVHHDHGVYYRGVSHEQALSRSFLTLATEPLGWFQKFVFRKNDCFVSRCGAEYAVCQVLHVVCFELYVVCLCADLHPTSSILGSMGKPRRGTFLRATCGGGPTTARHKRFAQPNSGALDYTMLRIVPNHILIVALSAVSVEREGDGMVGMGEAEG